MHYRNLYYYFVPTSFVVYNRVNVTPLISDRFDMRNKETFFTNAERSLIAKFVLDTTSYTTMKDETTQEKEVHMGTYSVPTPRDSHTFELSRPPLRGTFTRLQNTN